MVLWMVEEHLNDEGHVLAALLAEVGCADQVHLVQVWEVGLEGLVGYQTGSTRLVGCQW